MPTMIAKASVSENKMNCSPMPTRDSLSRLSRTARCVLSVLVEADAYTDSAKTWETWTGGPLKPGFGLSGAVVQLSRI